MHSWVKAFRAQARRPSSGPTSAAVDFADLRRVSPISRSYGFDRGRPVDRYYIEGFLDTHAADIHGHVLEIGDNSYTRAFGGQRVTDSDVLHVHADNPHATIIGDLTDADHIPSDSYDCAVITQTLHLIYDPRAALTTLHRILKPGGVLLATFPGISQVSEDEWSGSWFWGFSTQSAKRLFDDVFSASQVAIETFGNVLAATAFLQGIAAEELAREELDHRDADCELLLAVRAEKAVASPAAPNA